MRQLYDHARRLAPVGGRRAAPLSCSGLDALLKIGAERGEHTRRLLIAGGLWIILSLAVLLLAVRTLDNGLSFSKFMLVPLAVPGGLALFWLLKSDWPAALPRSEAAPLDRLALMMISLAMLTMTFNGVPVPGPLAISDLFLVAAFGAALPGLFERELERPMLLPTWLMLPAGLLVLVGLVLMIFLGGSLGSLAGLLRLVAALLLVPLTVGTLGGTQRAIVWLIDLWIASAVINCAVAIADYGMHLGIGEAVTHVESAGRSTGLTPHSNHLGVILCITTPLILSRMVIAKTTLQRLFFFGALAAVGVGVLTTGSRGAMVGFAGAVVIATAVLPREMRAATVKVLGVAALIGLVLAVTAFRSEVSSSISRLTGGSAETVQLVAESDKEREGLRAESLEQFSENPIFGAGLEHARDAHMIYLQLAASSGLVGLIAFLWFMLGSIVAALKRARAPELPLEVRAAVAAAGASVIVWALLGFVENQIADRYLYVPSGLVVAGIWYGIRNTSSHEQRTTTSS